MRKERQRLLRRLTERIITPAESTDAGLAGRQRIPRERCIAALAALSRFIRLYSPKVVSFVEQRIRSVGAELAGAKVESNETAGKWAIVGLKGGFNGAT